MPYQPLEQGLVIDPALLAQPHDAPLVGVTLRTERTGGAAGRVATMAGAGKPGTVACPSRGIWIGEKLGDARWNRPKAG